MSAPDVVPEDEWAEHKAAWSSRGRVLVQVRCGGAQCSQVVAVVHHSSRGPVYQATDYEPEVTRSVVLRQKGGPTVQVAQRGPGAVPGARRGTEGRRRVPVTMNVLRLLDREPAPTHSTCGRHGRVIVDDAAVRLAIAEAQRTNRPQKVVTVPALHSGS